MDSGGWEMGEDLSCSFCNAPALQVRHLIRGQEAYICDECVDQCLEVIKEQKSSRSVAPPGPPAAAKKSIKTAELTPETIVKHLDDYVIGQKRAKKLLSVAIYNHYKRIGKKLDCEVQKSNVIMIGPTGTGKTLLVSTLAKLFDVPFAVVDATSFTEAGYVGADVDEAIAKLVLAANGDVQKAEKGIVYWDEIDKIARTDSNGRDVRGEGVQQSLLKMLEGCTVSVNPKGGKKGPNTESVDVDTTNILFIVGGAFTSITDKQNKRRPLGLGADDSKKDTAEPQKMVAAKDLIRSGMIPEFVGRLPVITQLDPLLEEDLYRILEEPKNSLLKQYKALFSIDGIEVEFKKEFLKLVAQKAIKDGTGARGLRTILEQALSDLMFYGPGLKTKKLVIDEAIFHGAIPQSVDATQTQ